MVLVMMEDREEQPMLFYTIQEYQDMRTVTFWTGCGVGAVGTAVIGFISLWIAGAFIP